MSKKLILFLSFFLAIIIFVGIFLALLGTDQNLLPSEKRMDEIIIFYGEGCPACTIVNNHIAVNRLTEKIFLTQKEVYYNQANLSEFNDKFNQCQPPLNESGVPMLWDNGLCLIGDRNIIDYLNQRAS